MSAPPVSPDLEPRERLRVSIEITNICNFRCPFCPQAYQRDETAPAGSPYWRRQGMMSEAVFERTYAECQRVADTVELGFFGEQTLHRRYTDFLRRMRDRRFELELNTNVSFVTEEILDTWVDVGVEQVRLSLDAATAEAFDRARPGQVRDLAGRVVDPRRRWEAIQQKVERWLARPDHRPTRLVFVASSHNEGEREAFLARWAPLLGPDDHLLLKPVLSYGGKIADPRVEPTGNCNVWRMRYLMVDWQGDLSPCNLDTNMDLKLGNVMEGSLHGLYHGAAAQRLRGLTGCGGPLTPCRTCTDGNNWTGIERVRNPLHAPRPLRTA